MSKLPHEDHPLDVLGKKKSSKDEYYSFMLRQEKLKQIKQVNGRGGNFLSADEETALNAMSEKEKIELRTLARLYSLADTSPEYLQIKAITGGRDREEIAEKLTKLYMERVVVEDVLDRFISPSSAKTIIANAGKASRSKYDAFGLDK